MRFLTWIITVPVALVAVSFAVSNLDPVTLALWPLPFRLSAPLYLVGLLLLLAGFLAGGAVMWISQHRHRAARRREARRAAELQAEVAELKGRLGGVERQLADVTRKPAVSSAAIAESQAQLRIAAAR